MPPPSILLQPVTLTCPILVNPYQPPLPDNHTSIQPSSIAVRVLYALLPLSVLGVCEVGGNTKTSATTHISSELLVVSARPHDSGGYGFTSLRRVFIYLCLRRVRADSVSTNRLDMSSNHCQRSGDL